MRTSKSRNKRVAKISCNKVLFSLKKNLHANESSWNEISWHSYRHHLLLHNDLTRNVTLVFQVLCYRCYVTTVWIQKRSKFWLKCLLTFSSIQTFVNSNRCNITPPHAERPESRFAQGRYVTVDGGNYVTIFRFTSWTFAWRFFFEKKIITPHNEGLGRLCLSRFSK